MKTKPAQGDLRAIAKSALAWSPQLYRSTQYLDLALLRLFRGVHDPDYEIFRHLSPGSLVLDIGGNIGQSAISLANVNASIRIVSFEPNPRCAPYLRFVGGLIGRRFSWKAFGVGQQEESLVFYVPHVDGLARLQEGTFDRQTLNRPETAARIGEPDSIEELKIDVVRIDGLGFAPAGIKIDVQGHEMAVLGGAIETIAAYRPLLLIERGPLDGAIAALLQKLGYRPLAGLSGLNMGWRHEHTRPPAENE